jgi:hypothetical protein
MRVTWCGGERRRRVRGAHRAREAQFARYRRGQKDLLYEDGVSAPCRRDERAGVTSSREEVGASVDPPDYTGPSVVELRQYRLHPGRRDDLIQLFDSYLLEPQEAAGMQVIGQFRDLDDPNRFVWLRGFRDMETRERSLKEFYGGPVWRQWRDRANSTMVDSSDVLLLRPANPASGFKVHTCDRTESASRSSHPSVVVAIYKLDAPMPTGQAERFHKAIGDAVEQAGGRVEAHLLTEPSKNTFPALPVRENETVCVSVASFETETYAALFSDHAVVQRARDTGVTIEPLQRLRLSPTSRSLLPAASASRRQWPQSLDPA